MKGVWGFGRARGYDITRNFPLFRMNESLQRSSTRASKSWIPSFRTVPLDPLHTRSRSEMWNFDQAT